MPAAWAENARDPSDLNSGSVQAVLRMCLAIKCVHAVGFAVDDRS